MKVTLLCFSILVASTAIVAAQNQTDQDVEALRLAALEVPAVGLSQGYRLMESCLAGC